MHPADSLFDSGLAHEIVEEKEKCMHQTVTKEIAKIGKYAIKNGVANSTRTQM